MVLPREEHTDWLSSLERKNTSDFIGIQQVILRNISVYTNAYMHTITIDE